MYVKLKVTGQVQYSIRSTVVSVLIMADEPVLETTDVSQIPAVSVKVVSLVEHSMHSSVYF